MSNEDHQNTLSRSCTADKEEVLEVEGHTSGCTDPMSHQNIHIPLEYPCTYTQNCPIWCWIWRFTFNVPHLWQRSLNTSWNRKYICLCMECTTQGGQGGKMKFCLWQDPVNHSCRSEISGFSPMVDVHHFQQNDPMLHRQPNRHQVKDNLVLGAKYINLSRDSQKDKMLHCGGLEWNCTKKDCHNKGYIKAQDPYKCAELGNTWTGGFNLRLERLV